MESLKLWSSGRAGLDAWLRHPRRLAFGAFTGLHGRSGQLSNRPNTKSGLHHASNWSASGPWAVHAGVRSTCRADRTPEAKPKLLTALKFEGFAHFVFSFGASRQSETLRSLRPSFLLVVCYSKISLLWLCETLKVILRPSFSWVYATLKFRYIGNV